MDYRKFMEGLSEGVRSFVEVFVIAVFGFLPLALIIIKNNFYSESNVFEFWGPLFSNLSNGQLYLYVFSSYGTLLWLSIFDWRFPSHKVRSFLALLVVAMGLFLVAVANFDPQFSAQTKAWVVNSSYFAYAFSLVLNWFLLVSQKMRPPTITETTDQDVSRMEEKLKALTEGGK